MTNVSLSFLLLEVSTVSDTAGFKGSCRIAKKPHAVSSYFSFLISEHH